MPSPPPSGVQDLKGHIQHIKSDDALFAEFQRLDVLTGQQDGDYGLTSKMADVVPALNRYKDMLPYDQNIVRLDRDWDTYCGDQQPIGPLACGYDALGRAEVAPMERLPEYIATQGPLTHTEADFLFMVHQQRSPIVIMLCKYVQSSSYTRI
ncbi:unnamed protein product [Dibothriocephalus latus]|uniref:Tyrosine-protein phosphatase domain-containing protein n=1 Tax=Dibothriocephalus latus TaxID=60516 RepID=A0A3P7NQE4_DIBLA|nr:unnamed protein product [Dibothriocephalus latus]